MVLKYLHNRLKPSKLTLRGWPCIGSNIRRVLLKGLQRRGERRVTKKPYTRSIVGATLEVIHKRRTEKPEFRDAAREATLRAIKEGS
ncbi:60S ribosomal protein L24 isoform X1 [Hevea brasiliensis]|uniref:60S ribosomal protein L24 isoform X1 n=1 Tax=Hevea brasiliensis TaxID=3981 RepID=UPI0025F60A1D|nr:60S ribosomal protein L24 isoform X1 [Hevea brasiliensis]